MSQGSKDFSQGKVWRRVIEQAVPLTLAQIVQLLYNIVDRIYIGRMPDVGSAALTGIGLTFPLITLVTAFTSLYSMGGMPLFSIARGAGETDRARNVLGHAFSLLLATAFILMGFSYAFERPILYLFGASDASYPFAHAYLAIYLLGTPLTMLASGLNGFINAQGFPRIGMMTTFIGAILNLILDPIFIFGFHMGIAGAALATIISQAVSCFWVLRFLTSKQAIIPLERKAMRITAPLTKEIVSLGMAGFIMQATNCFVQIMCNTTLSQFGGDLYIGIMTVINSVRSVLDTPVHGLNHGSHPILGYNYGAKCYGRVRESLRFTTIIGLIYTTASWLCVFFFPKFFISIFSNDPAMLTAGPQAIHLYFFGFFFMSFQFAGQTAFQALGFAKYAIFFSLLRKAIIVVPLTFILPRIGFGVLGVFMAEPISNAIGGLACFITMYFKVYRKLGQMEQEQKALRGE